MKKAGRGELVRIMAKEMRTEMKPVIAEQKANVRSLKHAPPEWKTASARATRARVTTGAKTARIGIAIGKGKVGSQARNMNRGTWRHPLFGDTEHWYPQRVVSGWFDSPTRDADIRLRAKMREILDRYLRLLGGQ